MDLIKIGKTKLNMTQAFKLQFLLNHTFDHGNLVRLPLYKPFVIGNSCYG